eukprot:TRINITY_DN3576_c0_g1_i2.p3 TRINITY_DN3576_c0_g1~~TRINITY_DN3576_c0_g1_i2.p3  ORF type:complete len:291 (+),score=15.30 TRINITY_DN3576_c0_g1_i2:35-874(+)
MFITQSPFSACRKVASFCLSLLTSTVVTTVLVVDTAFEVSQRVYYVLLPDKKEQQKLLAEPDASFKLYRRERLKSLGGEANVRQLDLQEEQHKKLRKSKSYDAALVRLAKLTDVNQLQHGNKLSTVKLVPADSSTTSATCVVNDSQLYGPNSSSSSVVSESSPRKSSDRSRVDEVSQVTPTFRKSYSVNSNLNEEVETQTYIEELQIQVSQLMSQTSLVQQLQQRVEDLEKQRDLLTNELLSNPKDLLAENQMLRAQLQELSPRQTADEDLQPYKLNSF